MEHLEELLIVRDNLAQQTVLFEFMFEEMSNYEKVDGLKLSFISNSVRGLVDVDPIPGQNERRLREPALNGKTFPAGSA